MMTESLLVSEVDMVGVTTVYSLVVNSSLLNSLALNIELEQSTCCATIKIKLFFESTGIKLFFIPSHHKS